MVRDVGEYPQPQTTPEIKEETIESVKERLLRAYDLLLPPRKDHNILKDLKNQYHKYQLLF